MATSRKRKEEMLRGYQEWVRASSGFILTSYSGLSVKALDGLRRKVRDAGGDFQVVKNSLIQIAFRDAGVPILEAVETGTTAVGYGSTDLPAIAKAIVDTAREAEGLKLKGAVISGVVYSAKQVERLADLPPLPVVRAQFLGLLQAPASRVAGALAASVRQIVQVLDAYSKKEAEQAG